MRASDADRQRTVEELRRHCAAGRIDVDDYAVRIERALGATSLEELDALRGDLPMMRIAEPMGRGAVGPPVWAGPRPLNSGAGSDPDADEIAVKQRLTATAVAVVAVLVVFSAIVLSLVAEWTWAAVLVAGWLLGLIQGRLGRIGGRHGGRFS